jgi:hypothetical protein
MNQHRPPSAYEIAIARHALHHKRLSWEYMRDALNPPLPRHAEGYRQEARASRERAWWNLNQAMQMRPPSPARQRKMS